MNGKEFALKYTEDDLRDISKKISESIVIRTYIDGTSYDNRRETTEVEKAIIQKIAFGAMLAYRFIKSDLDGILNVAEFTLRQFVPKANAYDTIYIPLRKVTETW